MGRIVDYPIAENVTNKDNVFINQDNELKQISVANVLAPVRHDYADLYNDVQSLKLQEYEQTEATHTLTDTLNGSIKMREYKGMTHKSKNLINGTWIDGTFLYKATGTTDNSAGYSMLDKYIDIKPNTTYTLSGMSVAGEYAGYCFYDASKTYISGTQANTFTTPNTAKYIRVCSRNATLNNPQLEEGSQATAYEPYGMRSTGDMGLVDLSTLNFSVSNNIYTSNGIANKVKKASDNWTTINLISSEYTTTNYGSIAQGAKDKCIAIDTSGNIRIRDTSGSIPSGLLAYEVADGEKASQYGIVIKEHGKNLFNPKDILYGTYTADVWNIPYPSAKALNFKFEENTQYTFSAYVSQFKGNDGRYANVRFLIYYTDGTQSDLVLLAPSENPVYLTFTSRSGKTIESLWATYGSGSVGAYASYRNFQIERGTQATSYVPHQGKTVFIPISQPLHTEDKLYKVDGKYKEYHKMAEVDLGSIEWTLVNSEFWAVRNTQLANSIKVDSSGWCSKFYSDYSISNIFIASGGYIRLYTSSTNAPTGKLVYELAEPTLTDAIDQTSFYQLESYDEQTTIELESYDGFNALGSMAYEYAIHETTQMALNGEQLGEKNSAEIEQKIQSGNATALSTGWVTIPFNKKFASVPNVVATINSKDAKTTTLAVMKIGNITNASFDACCVTSSGYVTSDFSWIATI